MKTVTAMAIAILMLFNAAPILAAEEGSALISGVEVSLKTAEKPNRLEISFDLTQPVDLSEGESDIVFELLGEDGGNPMAVLYRKDKSWSGYLNSYDNYPAGERKYSSGTQNGSYPDSVPDTRIYTSTKTGASIDVATVAAVRVTVLRADGSGEAVTADIEGAILDFEEIEPVEVERDNAAGIIVDGADSNLPSGTVLVADELAGGEVYEKVDLLLTGAKDFIVIDISLEAGGQKVQPNGKVKISIPVPERFGLSGLAVYRISGDQKVSYPVTVTERDGINYATFESDHFSVYVLAEITESQAEPIPESTVRNQSDLDSGGERSGFAGDYQRETITEINEPMAPLSNMVPITGAAGNGISVGAGCALLALSLFIAKRKG